MEKTSGIETKFGVITGRDGIYLNNIKYIEEAKIKLEGELNTAQGFKNFDLVFTHVVYCLSVEIDFDTRQPIESFGYVKGSEVMKKLIKLDHSFKIDKDYKHYYLRTYDIVFEIIAKNHQLNISS